MKTLREYIDQLDEISRRDFLKGAGATAGLAAMGAPKDATAQEVVKWANYARKLALDSVGNVSDQNWELRDWIAQNVSIWVSNYCEYTNSYNAKNVIDYANEEALNASGFKDTNWLLRGFGLYDLKRRSNDFLTTYRAAIQEKTKEFDGAREQQKQQQQQQQNLHPIFTKPYAELNMALTYYYFAKELDQSKVPAMQAELSRYIKATNEKELVNAGYRLIQAELEKIKNSNPQRYKELSASYLPHGQHYIDLLKKVISRKEPEFKEESVDEAATPDAVKRIEQLIQYK
jgi:hypothetical protein